MRLRRALVVMSIVGVAAPMTATAGASPGTPTLDITLGVDGSDLPALTGAPRALDVTPDGNVFVAGASGVNQMTAVGEHFANWTYPGAVGITNDGNGTWYVTNNDGTAINVVNSSGATTHTIPLGPSDDPGSLAYDPLSPYLGVAAVYAVLSNTGRVAEVDAGDVDGAPDEATRAVFGSNARAVAVAPDHTVLVARTDGGFDRYTSQGVRINSSKALSDGVTDSVSGLTVDAAGTVFLATGGEIVEADLSGHRLGAFGEPNPDAPGVTQPGDFNGSTDVAVDCAGRLFVLDSGSDSKGQVLRFSGVAAATGPCSQPASTSYAAPGSIARYVAVDRADNVYLSLNQTLDKYDAAGHRVTGWGSTSDPTDPTHPGQFLPGHWGLTSGLAVASNGDLLVSSSQYFDGVTTHTMTGTISEFRPAGAFVRSFTAGAGGVAFGRPGALLVRPGDGHLFVADAAAGNVQELDASRTFVRTYSPTGLGGVGTTIPTALALNPNGKLLVAVRQSVGVAQEQLTAIQTFDTSTGVQSGSVTGPQVAGSGEVITGLVSTNDVFLAGLGNVAHPSFYPQATQGLVTLLLGGAPVQRLLDPVFNSDSPRPVADCAGRVYAGSVARNRVYVLRYSTAKCTWLPTAVTGAFVSRTKTSLTVKGSANPSAQVTKMRVLYGTTTKYGKATSWVTLPSDNITLTKSFVLGGLLHAHTYHYKVQVQNPSGTVNGKDRTGTTA